MKKMMHDILRGFVLVAVVAGFTASAHALQKSPEFIIHKDNALPVTVFNITFRVGSADDPTGYEGLAFLTARLIREGGLKAWNNQPARSREELEDFLYPLAGEIDERVAREQTSFIVATSASESMAILNVLSQMVLAPAFNATEFERVKSEVLEELEKRAPREDEEELGKAALERALYGKDHPYGHAVVGTVSGVKRITLEKIQEFYKNFYVRRRLIVGAAGVVSPLVSAKLKSVFVTLPEGISDRAVVPAPQTHEGLRLTLVKGPFDATGVHLGHPLPFNRSAGADFAHLYLASLAFGKHRSFVGRLMNVVRAERGLNYGAYSYVEEFPQGGRRLSEPTQVARQQQSFTVWARPSTLENGCFLLRQVHREVKHLAAHGLTKEEFDLAQSHLVGSAPLLATGLERRLNYAIDASFYQINGDYLKLLQDRTRAATLNGVNGLLKKYIHPEQMDVVVVTPDTEKYKKEILGTRCNIHYAPGIEKSGAVKTEDEDIATYAAGLKTDNIQTIEAEEIYK